MNRAGIVRALINKVKFDNKHLDEVKQKLIQRYTVEKVHQLEDLTLDHILDHDYEKELRFGCTKLEKYELVKKNTIGFETHKYAPELNCLHFKNGSVMKVHSSCDTIEEAYLWLAGSESLDRLKEQFKKDKIVLRKIFGYDNVRNK